MKTSSFVPVTAGQVLADARSRRSFTVPGRRLRRLRGREGTDTGKAGEERPGAEDVGAETDGDQAWCSDFWNGELNTSTVLMASRIDPLPAPLTPQQQADRPYAMGMMEIVPTFDSKLSKKSELSTFMLIYNPKVDSANKPDVQIEYNFYQAAAGNQPEAGASPARRARSSSTRRARKASTRKRCRRSSISAPDINSRPDRPCRSRDSPKATTAWKSR